MNKKTWVAMFLLCLLGLWLLAGCEKKENTNEAQTTSPTSQAPPAAIGSAGRAEADDH